MFGLWVQDTCNLSDATLKCECRREALINRTVDCGKVERTGAPFMGTVDKPGGTAPYHEQTTFFAEVCYFKKHTLSSGTFKQADPHTLLCDQSV